ncbi:hypothetical protein DWB61_13610 [Ancylomarina euxinus]|uniref:Outer membrane protein beta-barrel domain-containing protein n=1 Tax=Ancylomarina euxinus TaxID=2283627 RepID=A0A425XYT7_9BACT|nr:hypothetical protein [Ancylomarina euxinus]MCZ4695759.1 hypothetical protein [Ancylomarina euxinus]MUP16212.1 hypothetical protein [Ancylomarina euxinus]RRG20071.1 hypothetical protein DWB61_13610 [Ancylomarina euxinus]
MRKVFLILVLVSIVLFALGQDQYINRDIKPNMSLQNPRAYTLDFFNGMSFPQGDLNNFLKDGFNSGILLHKKFSKKISIGLSANYSQFNHREALGLEQNSKRHELNTTSFEIGPQYNLKFGRFALEFYGRSGLSIVNSPQTSMMYPETDITITTLEAYNSTALMTRLGANMTANIFQGLNFYFSSEYLTSLNKDMNYQVRDISEAIREDGTLDSDAANQLPYRNERLSLSMLNVNIGVRIFIGGNTNKRKHKSLYQDNDLLGDFLMSERPIFSNNDMETRTENNHSSQGNKASIVASDSDQYDESRDQDFHSNRPINTSIIAPEHEEKESRLDSQTVPADEATLADIPEEKLRFKSKAQLAKEERQKKRTERRLKRLKAKL